MKLNLTRIKLDRQMPILFWLYDQLNLEILKKFNENNLEFAFPSQTIYAKQVWCLTDASVFANTEAFFVSKFRTSLILYINDYYEFACDWVN